MADLLRSELLPRPGFAHGFALRTGGVSAPPFDSLNLGRGLGDAPDAVARAPKFVVPRDRHGTWVPSLDMA